MQKEILTCRNLTVGYEGFPLCREINFTLHEGEYMCVVGEHGTGKSALIATLMGIIPPIEGEVIFENGLTRDEIGCMPQSLDLRGTSTALDIVLSGCLRKSKHLFIRRAEKELAKQTLERLNVGFLADRRVGELSGGQRQRVMLARTICSAGRLLLLDEPMQGLDAFAKDELFSEIAALNQEDGIATVIVDGEALDGTILHLSDTQLFCGSVQEYRRSVPGQFYYQGRVI